MDAFYTIDEISEMLKISRRTAYRLIESGDLPAFKIGREFRVSAEDFEAFLTNSRISTKGVEITDN